MGAIASAFSSAFRDYSTDGVPASGIHSVAKSDARALGTTIEAQLTGLLTGGSTLAAADGSASTPGITFSADLNTGIFRPTTDVLAFATGGSERARFGASGGLHIGGTSPSSSVPLKVSGGDVTFDTTNGTHALTCTAGTGGTTKTLSQSVINDGRVIYNLDGSYYEFRLSNSAKFFVGGSAIYPAGDNSIACGQAGNRFSVVYAGTGSINTSDERTKDWRGALQPVEIRAALEIAREIGVFRFRDEIARKGLDGARDHIGVRAQRVWGIMAKHGLVEPIGDDGRPSGACRYAFLCYDEWEAEVALDPIYSSRPSADGSRRVIRTEEKVIRDAGSLYGIRPDELNMFLMAALFSAVMPEE